MERLIIVTVLLLPAVLAATEVLKNHDMEMTHFNNNWMCQGCQLNTSTDSYSGYHSVMVTNRHHTFDGLSQNVHVVAGSRYNLSMVIKPLNLHGTDMYVSVDLRMACQNAQGHRTNVVFGREPHARKDVWTEMGGIMTVPAGLHSCHVFVQVASVPVNYLADHASLMVVPDDANWRTEANTRINQLRKANINIHLDGPTGGNYDVELTQTSSEFAFGSAVASDQIVDPALQKYQDAFYENFEWAVLENALKWRLMEWRQGHPNYAKPLNAINALRNHGVKVRGHNVFWDFDKHSPAWIGSMNKSTLLGAMHTRVNGVIGATKGLLEHWDVNNEALHGDWFERVTGNPNITVQMFQDVHSVDSKPKLFLNDYSILRSPSLAMAYKNQAVFMRNAGAPIYGVGIQSHIKTTFIDVIAIKEQLDTVARAGLPIWITELSMVEDSHHTPDNNRRAAALTDLLTIFFSHPAVEGVLFWGFWDGKIFDSKGALFEGPNVTPNEVGLAYQKLYKTTWRTNEKHTLPGGGSTTVHGFRGGYSVTVKLNGHVLDSETFTLGAGGKTVQIHLHGTPQIIVG